MPTPPLLQHWDPHQASILATTTPPELPACHMIVFPGRHEQCVSFLQRAHAPSTDQCKGATEVQLSELMGFR